MALPKRTIEHVIEAESWKIFEAKSPRSWIIREVTERDYGIDAYVEFVLNGGEVSGELCSIQLKGTSAIEWIGPPESRSARLSVQQSTVQYWMNFPVPVFLILTDVSTRQAYFAPVKSQIRKQFPKLDSQKTLGFIFEPRFELGISPGDVWFLLEYSQESNQRRFQSTLRDFLIHWQQYLDFIQEYKGRDQHLGIDCDEEIMFQHVYASTEFMARFLNVDGDLPPLAKAYEAEAAHKDPHYRLHQFTVEIFMTYLEPVFLGVIHACREHLLGPEIDFWRSTDPALVEYCRILGMPAYRERLKLRE